MKTRKFLKMWRKILPESTSPLCNRTETLLCGFSVFQSNLEFSRGPTSYMHLQYEGVSVAEGGTLMEEETKKLN